MAHNLADADAFQATVQVADDGDAANAASLYSAAGVGFQALANRTRYLYNRSIECLGGYVQVPIQPSFLLNAHGIPGSPQSIDWQHYVDIGTPAIYWLEVAAGIVDATTGNLVIALPSYQGAAFDAFSMALDGPAHGAWPLGQMPSWTIFRTTNAGVTTQIATQADASAQVDYELPHDVDGTFAAQTFDDDSQYVVVIHGESGANAAAGLRLYSAKLRIVAV